jgi:outer membrane protein OmpA-like peptidoglycan-associated protein
VGSSSENSEVDRDCGGEMRPLSLVVIALGSRLPAATPPGGKIPLCPGLTVVTAISQPEGDYESIKTVESMDANTVRLKYSTEQPPERLAGGGSRIRKLTLSRVVRISDLANGKLYEQIFGTNIPAEMPGTTAIGTSRAVLTAVKTQGEAELGVFNIPPASIGSSYKISSDRKQHPNVFDYTETYKLRRVERTAVKIPVIVNEARTELPAIHVTGRSDFYGYKAEFFFLDDESNPLSLKWRLGIGATAGQNAGADRDTLQVIKIAFRCSSPPGGMSLLEHALAETGHADVYDIYFDFNSDEIRDESEPTLHDIGDILRRHPEWKLSIAGHTDSIGGDAPNLDLSKRRAAAVKNALVARFGVNNGRLVTTGYGKSRPVDTNETPEGRARNRRVELVKLP